MYHRANITGLWIEKAGDIAEIMSLCRLWGFWIKSN